MKRNILFFLALGIFIVMSCESPTAKKNSNKTVNTTKPQTNVGTSTSTADKQIAVEDVTRIKMDPSHPLYQLLHLGTAEAQEKEANGDLECPVGQLLYGVTAAGELLCRSISSEQKVTGSFKCVQTTLTYSVSGICTAYGCDPTTIDFSKATKSTNDASATTQGVNSLTCSSKYKLVYCDGGNMVDTATCKYSGPATYSGSQPFTATLASVCCLIE